MKNEWLKLLFAHPELICFDNEGDGDGDAGEAGDEGDDGDDGEQGGSGNEGGEGKSGEERTFTQKDVDEIVIKRNKKLKQQYEMLEKQHQQLLKNKNLTDEQRKSIENDLEQLRDQFRTKEEKLRNQANKEKTELQLQLNDTASKAELYQKLYEDSTIERAITDAQSKFEGYNSDQFIALLRPKSEIVEEMTTDGEKTGRLVPRIRWEVKQDDGKVETVLLTAEEAVEKMKEDDSDRFANMFRPNIARGVGGGTAPGQQSTTGKIDHKRMTDAEYMELRRKDPEAFKRAAGLA